MNTVPVVPNARDPRAGNRSAVLDAADDAGDGEEDVAVKRRRIDVAGMYVEVPYDDRPWDPSARSMRRVGLRIWGLGKRGPEIHDAHLTPGEARRLAKLLVERAAKVEKSARRKENRPARRMLP
jgi:hypothetical protein